jgi:hypothetical protein
LQVQADIGPCGVLRNAGYFQQEALWWHTEADGRILCPACRRVLIRRSWHEVVENLVGDRCPAVKPFRAVSAAGGNPFDSAALRHDCCRLETPHNLTGANLYFVF